MATLTKGYYHCLECGALFESALKKPSDQRCPICGNPPTGKILAGTAKDQYATQEKSDVKILPRAAGKLHGINHDTQDIYEATMATMSAQQESRRGRVKRTKRKELKSKKRWMLIGVWLVLMVGVVGAVKYFGNEDEDDSVTQVDGAGVQKREAAAHEKKKALIIEAAMPICEKVMTQFLMATSAASKAQFVDQGVQHSGAMNRYYRGDISFSTAVIRVKIAQAELLEGFPVRTVGALCLNERGEKWEAVFVQDGKEWKLDWESLVRYDDKSWALFPAGKDGDEGEFRLYLRVRDSNEDFEQKEMSLVFYKPTMFVKNEFRGVASTPMSVPIDSELGRQISILVKEDKEKEGGGEILKDAHGLMIGYMDPSRYHRVRVKMRLHKEGKDHKKSRIELLEILANDWYGIEKEDSVKAE